ncbi:MAG: DUF3606 domain-containing protein [Rubrivivax sp.]|nr:MAG: DUF3606 domain-containing protein [Rubrivivax sp.]
MDTTPSPAETPRRIDLTQQTDVQFWCRVFDLSMDELRDAVHHAGHQVEEVERYLRHKKQPPQ